MMGATDGDSQKHRFKKCIVFSQAFEHLGIARDVDENRQGIFRNWLNHRALEKVSEISTHLKGSQLSRTA